MPVRTSFPYETDHADVHIPLPDGTRLYARVWRPLTDEPVPALLEYDPGRLTDGTAPRDAQRHPWYAGHGYASVRVDPRGHGNSEGLPSDVPGAGAGAGTGAGTDLDDVRAVVEWLAGRPWCTGRVGMVGLGPGGTLALRAATLPLEALAAVVAVCATDDHDPSSGGFAPPVAATTAVLARTAQPPDPLYAREAWRALWTARLAALEVLDPVDIPRRIPLEHTAVRVPVLAVGGWHDPYRDTVLRLVEHLPRDLVRGLLGPWPHRYPDRGEPPGPAIGFLQETLRWWDHHLKGVPNGVMAEPLLRSRIRNAADSGWRGDETWPSRHVTPVTYAFQGSPVLVRSPLHTGLDAGRFTPSGGDADLPPDQRAEDAHSACFGFLVPADGMPLEILGRPLVRVAVRTVRTCEGAASGRLTARLCDVAPDGASTLVTRGTVAFRPDGDASRTYTCELGATGYAFRPGHRVRIALSSAYWPWVWPEPHDTEAALTLDPAGSSLHLPVRSPAPPIDTAVAFAAPQQAEPLGVSVPAMLDGMAGTRPPLLVVHDVARGSWRLEADPCSDEHGSVRTYPDGLEITEQALETYDIDASRPLSARVGTEWRIQLHRPDLPQPWNATVEARSETAWADGELLTRTELVCGHGGDEVLFHHTWEKRLPRP